jgi:flavin-dependent dehydrogenase
MRPVIIGGGLAGGGAAARLAAMGQRPLLLEREAGDHDKVCGEFLSVEAGRHLEALGLDVARLGGSRIDTMRFRAGSRTAAARLPFVATGVTRRQLDAALLDHAVSLGAGVHRDTPVRHIAEGRAVTADGAVDAGPLLLATGKHDLRGQPRDPEGTISGLIGFKQFFRATPALTRRLAGAVEVTIFGGGYAGLQAVENGRLNLCLLIDAAAYKAFGNWEALFARLLREPGLAPLAEAEQLLAKPLGIASVPYGFLAAPEDALWRLGDQAAVIPSFCGDGMAIALHSGRLAADMLAGGATAPAYQARLRREVGGQVRLATRLQRIGTSRLGRFALITGLGAVPAALAALARWTRVEPQALAAAGV